MTDATDLDRSRDPTERAAPLVSIGLPVFNGERFLARSIESVLNQTYKNLELIISDNASTDGTAEIWTRYAAADPRIVGVTNDRNIGAAPNFNRAFSLATGRYFKWTTYDDWLEPTYIERCVEVLENRPGVVACWPRTKIYDEDGEFIESYTHPAGLMSSNPHERLFHWIWNMKEIAPIFGVFPTEVVRQTRLMESYASADRTFFAEILLRGDVVELDEPLYCMTRTKSVRSGRDTTWWNPDNAHRPSFDRWKYLLRMAQTIATAPELSPGRRIQMSVLNLMFFARRWPRRSLALELGEGIAYYGRRLTTRGRPASRP
jgi:glycosyltransferase involved in cell wall biosynthesis